jgi:excisionase family DNA binding protein
MHVTLGEASRQTGLSKSTISRAIRDGKLSAERCSETNSYRIETSELQRYLDATAVTRATAETVAVTRSATPTERDRATDALVAELRAVIADLRHGQDDLRQERDRWRIAFENTQRQLAPAAPVTRQLWHEMSWRERWRWLRTTG